MQSLGFKLYLLFVVSWFLHLPARVPFLGLIRFDLILVGSLAVLAYLKSVNSDTNPSSPGTQTGKLLGVLLVYSILTVPFVEWQGSVIKFGIPNFIKAIVFYYFTVAFVDTEKNFKRFISVFLTFQILRVLEPLYLHITQGYWGSRASMLGGTEFLNRLSGSPYDVVNPNGLAYIIVTIVPFLYFMAGLSWKTRLAFILFLPVCLYVLALTGSRSGAIGLIVVFLGILVKSNRRFILGSVTILVAVIGFSFLSPDMQDRYLSITGKSEKNRATVEGRREGMAENFGVVLRRPFFGHGLGTSAEANANFVTSGPYAYRALPAHNLYLELAIELGLVGLILYLFFMRSIFLGFFECQRLYRQNDAGAFLQKVLDAMQVWLVMNVVFSFASYGLSSYDWYLFGGFAVVMQRFAGVKSFGKSDRLHRYPHKEASRHTTWGRRQS